MPQAKTLISAQTSVGPGAAHAVMPGSPNRGFVVSIAAAPGVTVSGTIVIEVSTDGAIWTPRVTFTFASGVVPALGYVSDTDVDANQPFPQVRANVTALTGTGAAVTASVSAA